MRYHVMNLSVPAAQNMWDVVTQNELCRVSVIGKEAVIEVLPERLAHVRERLSTLFDVTDPEIEECHPECACRHPI